MNSKDFDHVNYDPKEEDQSYNSRTDLMQNTMNAEIMGGKNDSNTQNSNDTSIMKGISKDEEGNFEMIETSGAQNTSNLELIHKSQHIPSSGDIEIMSVKKSKSGVGLFPAIKGAVNKGGTVKIGQSVKSSR